MARSTNLQPGDRVEFCGKPCSVVRVFHGSEIIVVKHDGSHGSISYTSAKYCKKVHQKH